KGGVRIGTHHWSHGQLVRVRAELQDRAYPRGEIFHLPSRRGLMTKIVTTIAVLVAVSGAAQAADLYTPPIWGGNSNQQYILCKIANVTTKNKIVNVEVLGSTGSQLMTSGDQTLTPGQAYALFAGYNLNDQVRCHFHGPGVKGGYRAQATFING